MALRLPPMALLPACWIHGAGCQSRGRHDIEATPKPLPNQSSSRDRADGRVDTEPAAEVFPAGRCGGADLRGASDMVLRARGVGLVSTAALVIPTPHMAFIKHASEGWRAKGWMVKVRTSWAARGRRIRPAPAPLPRQCTAPVSLTYSQFNT